ncbi:MAG: hypothetical protein GIKADHBN_02751 [Phycisphaerales bacterium]|nr:hypothetical protein [Phycisphaerales bacterium]
MSDPSSEKKPDPGVSPTPYELEPAAPDAAPRTPPVPIAAAAKPGPAPGKLAAEGVLSGFDEDADFDRDPEVERALGKNKRPPAPSPAASETALEPFVTPWLGNAQIWGVVGGFLLVGAIVAAAMNLPNKFPAALLVLYNGMIQTGTGLVAVYLTARLAGMRIGAIDLATARMLVAVSAFLLLFNLNIHIAGSVTNKWEELLIATAAYVGSVAGLFRLWGRNLGILVITHFVLWLVFELGVRLDAWASAGVAAAGKAS